MISSRNTLASLEQAIRGVRRDEDNLASVLRNASQELSQLRSNQANAFRDLARLRLDSIRQGEVIGRLDDVESRALGLFQQWQQRMETAMAGRQQLEGQIAAAEDDRLEKVDVVEAAIEAIAEFKEASEAEVEANPDWVEESKRLEAAVAVANAADEKAKTAEADLENKGKPYRDDPLFMYLWKAEYGTSRYKGGFISRYFDGKIARLIGYNAARDDFHNLTEIPRRLRQHADDVAETAERAEDGLEAVERRLLEAKGIKPLEGNLNRVHGLLAQAESRVNELRAAFDARAKEDDVLLDPERDSAYRQAVEMLAKAMEREDLNQLWQEAQQTRNTEDEGVVRQLDQYVNRIKDVERQIGEARQATATLAAKRAELEASRARFYRSGYDNPIGGFSNGDMIGEAIGGILAGAMRDGRLGDLFDQGYLRTRRPRRGGLSRGVRFPSGGSWTGGGSMGGRSRGPSRAGGFRTTGGF